MSKATTKEKPATQTAAPQEAPAASLPATIAPRLPYPRSVQDAFGITPSDWIVLCDVIFPNATSHVSIVLALRYCKARKLDVMKKMIHIVPIYSSALGKTVDSIWPGIAEVRVTATRTGIYAGRDEEQYGPEIEETFQHLDDRKSPPEVKREVTMKIPEWCQLTVYKIVAGIRCAFVGPKVYWKEAYATESRYSKIPNEMWTDRNHGQLGKCAEAAALRAAFPEEIGGQLTAEEMHGRVIEGQIDSETMVVQEEGIMNPPRPKQSDFVKPEEKPKGDVKVMAGGHDVTDRMPLTKAELERQQAEADPRPEPTPVGEEVESGEAGHPEEKQDAVEPKADEAVTEPTESRAFAGAEKWLKAAIDGLPQEQDLEAFKKHGRAVIDSFAGLTEDETEDLRGMFVTALLTEQRKRAGRKK